MQAGAAGAPHGSVYIADAQTAGRGRGGHQWASPACSGLYVSILLRPALAPGDALWLSLAAGLSAIDAVTDAAMFTPDLRWPNDLMAGRRKLGGILTEMQAEATRVRFVVIGIGINVHQNWFPEELAARATSLAMESPGLEITRTALLALLLQNLEREAGALTGTEPQTTQRSLVQRIESRSSWVRGKKVIVGEDAPFEGTTEGLDARGFLRVRTADGALRTVLSGGGHAACARRR
jgi:BirA family biotin operon repressor/biotin-[acetyl-CoA-carboxylase] ligase